MKAELLEKYTDLYVKVAMNGETLQIDEYTVDKSGDLSFRFQDIAPQTIGDHVTAVLYAKENGADVATVSSVSGIAHYCARALEYYSADTHAIFRTLIVDLLRYGAKAQVYTGYNTDALWMQVSLPSTALSLTRMRSRTVRFPVLPIL